MEKQNRFRVLILILLVYGAIITFVATDRSQEDLMDTVDLYGIAQFNAGTHVGRNAMIQYVQTHKDSLFSEEGKLILHIDVLLDIEMELAKKFKETEK